MANENCLKGLACPQCKSEGPFFIVGHAEFEVYDDGTSEFTDADWDDDSAMRCPCGKRGTVKDFTEEEKDG